MTEVDTLYVRHDRFRALAALIGPDGKEWLTSIIQNGAFIAGGAALFVADAEQCIDDVGDIDIWCPVPAETIRDWVDALLRRVEGRIYMGAAICYVQLEFTTLQFIRVDKTPDQVLAEFDFDCLQVAIRASPSPSFSVCLERTPAAGVAWRTRLARRIGDRDWVTARHHDATFIAKHRHARELKIVRKGFSLTNDAPPARHHVCQCTRQARHDVANDACRVDDILEMGLFDVETYIGPPRTN